MKAVKYNAQQKSKYYDNELSVEVFCRLKSSERASGFTSLRLLSPKIVGLSSCGSFNKDTYFEFKKVFAGSTPQKTIFDSVALPLIKNLFAGVNGLLFVDGVNGGGKNYTLLGEPMDSGLVPRYLDIIFNSITEFRAKRNTLIPDYMNGFSLVTNTKIEHLACENSEYDRHIHQSLYVKDYVKFSNQYKIDINDTCLYSVFVTCTEIYNNKIFDLLEESGSKAQQNRILRCDSYHNMFVYGAKEIEVTNPKEALQLFREAFKKRKAGHFVFTIRLAQIPFHNSVLDNSKVPISQLSLVNLARIEKTANNIVTSIKNIGGINNSLITLRLCLEILRENQLRGTCRIIPYRDSKLTHLFKNFFEGDGKMHILLCVNTHVINYEETFRILKFAEKIVDEVFVSTLESSSDENDDHITAVVPRNCEDILQQSSGESAVEDPIYNLGPFLQSVDLNCESVENIDQISVALKERMERRLFMFENLCTKENTFRCQILEAEKENTVHQQEIQNLKMAIQKEKEKQEIFGRKIAHLEDTASEIHTALDEHNSQKAYLINQLKETEMKIRQQAFSNERSECMLQKKLEVFSEELVKEKEMDLVYKKNKFLNKMNGPVNTLEQLQSVLNSKYCPMPFQKINVINTDVCHTQNETDETHALVLYEAVDKKGLQGKSTSEEACNQDTEIDSSVEFQQMEKECILSSEADGKLTSINRVHHQRPHITGKGTWVDHRPALPTKPQTVFQPNMQKRKAFKKLTDPSTFVQPNISNYCLMTEEQDSEGEMETVIYKGDVVRTVSGGAQVILNDVEALQQRSPLSPTTKTNTQGDIFQSPHRVSIVKRPRI